MIESKPTLVTPDEIVHWQQRNPLWKIEEQTLTRHFDFQNFYQTMAFVNAVAFIAHQQDHHPDLVVSYNKCRVSYTTHAVNGLSNKDFEAAARIDLVLE